MEHLTYYRKNGTAYTYDEIIYAIEIGNVNLNEYIIAIDNLDMQKIKIKAKTLLTEKIV